MWPCCQLGTVCTDMLRWLYQTLNGRRKSKVVWIQFWCSATFHFIFPSSYISIYIISRYRVFAALCQLGRELSDRSSVAWLGGTRPHKLHRCTVAAREVETWLINTRVYHAYGRTDTEECVSDEVPRRIFRSKRNKYSILWETKTEKDCMIHIILGLTNFGGIHLEGEDLKYIFFWFICQYRNYIASMTEWLMNWKGSERRRFWPNRGAIPEFACMN
jgi:hypothetical protein